MRACSVARVEEPWASWKRELMLHVSRLRLAVESSDAVRLPAERVVMTR